MNILNLLHSKTKYKILSNDDIDFSESELDKIKSFYLLSSKIEINLNKTLKEIIKNIKIIPNYDSYICHLIRLYEEFEVNCNPNLIKEFIEIVSPIERIGITSFSYIWAIKYLVIDIPNQNKNNLVEFDHCTDANFWQKLSGIVNVKLKYLCQFALMKHAKISISFEQLKRILQENNSNIVLHDLKSLNVADDLFINNLLESIKLEDGDLWAKIKIETIKQMEK